VTAGALPDSLRSANVVLVTVRDRQVSAALSELLTAPLAPGAVVLHASASLDPAEVLTLLRARGHPAGTFHPLVPLPDGGQAVDLLRGASIGVEGDEAAVRVAKELATRLSAHVLPIPKEHRVLYHAAAVFASNFAPVLAALATSLMHRAGVGEDEARAAVRHLMAAATANLVDAEPGSALTGPISRGDSETVARHLDALAGQPELDAVYRALSRAAIPLAAEQGVDGAALERITLLLEVSPRR
jgi:predicted short-subunit dehydrogenase-like oxidoreductase (DUF2520 family)